MAAHIVTVIDQARKESIVVGVNDLAELDYYKHSAGYAPWGNVLDLRDLLIIDTCESWEELLKILDALEAKYDKLWQLAGQPSCWEQWKKRLDYTKPNSVDIEYWNTYHMEVDYGKPVTQQA